MASSDFKFKVSMDGNGSSGEVPSEEITVERGVTEGDKTFYDWAKGHMRETEENPDLGPVRLVHHRRWRWPRIWDMYDVRRKPGSPTYDGQCIHCEMEFSRRVAWPWWKAMGWWIREGARDFWRRLFHRDAIDEISEEAPDGD